MELKLEGRISKYAPILYFINSNFLAIFILYSIGYVKYYLFELLITLNFLPILQLQGNLFLIF